MVEFQIDELEGLWKLIIPLPRYGLMKTILELEIDNNQPEGYVCMADKFESDFDKIEWKSQENRLIAHAKLLGFSFEFNLTFEDDKCKGFLAEKNYQIPVEGVRMQMGVNEDSLSKEDFIKYQEELDSKQIREISPMSDEEIVEKVEDLLNHMTLEEKIGQMYQAPSAGNITGPDTEIDNIEVMIKNGKVGSFLGIHNPVHSYAYQKIAVEQSRLGIPLMFMADVIHGFRTIFPIPLALASSWDMNAIERSERVAAIESGVSGIHLSFAPMVDISRDPRWGRIMEGAGEDPYLGACCAAAHIKGFQGSDLSSPDTIIAFVKHFAAYGGAEAGRDYNTVDMSEYRLRNYYLPPYKGAVDADVGCLMTSFNCILGRPATGNRYLLNKILRDEWNFKGMTISDYNSVIEMIAHGTAKDMEMAAKDALESTLDIEMVSAAYLSSLERLIEKNEVEIELINNAVRRVLYYKHKLGLFNDPYRYMNPKACEELHLCNNHREIARDVAKRTIVLLENKEVKQWDTPILPLTPFKLKEIKRIALIGPFGDEQRIIGAWSCMGNATEAVSLKQGIENYFEKLESAPQLDYAKGCAIKGNGTKGFEEALDLAEQSDLVILALGEDQNMSGEAKSRGYLNIPGRQEKLAKKINELGKPTILVLFNGRPLVLDWFSKTMDAIVEAWMPGTEGGNAISEVLFGDYNPSAKLTATFPFALGQVPIFYNHYSTGRPPLTPDSGMGFLSTYIDMPNEPLYPFGYGLSYTAFEYSNLELDKQEMKSNEEIKVKVQVKNTGKIEGEEIIQLYIQDIVGSYVRPVKMLKGFQKVLIRPGETKEIEFTMTTDMLAYWLMEKGEYRYKPEKGDFIVFVGSSSTNCLQKVFTLV